MADTFDAKAALDLLHETAQVLSSRWSEPEVIEVLLERFLAALSGGRACLHLLSPDGLQLVPAGDCTARGVGRVPGAPIPVEGCSLFERVTREEVVVISDPDRLGDPVVAAIAGERPHAVVAVLLAARDHPLGMLMVLMDRGVVLRDEDRLTLHILADLAAIALEKTRQQQSLLSITAAVNSTLETEPMLERVLAATVQNLWLQAASIRLLDSKRQALELAAVCGLGPGYRERARVVAAESPLDRRALKGEPVVVNDSDGAPELPFPPEAAREGIRSILAIAVRHKDRPVGVIRVYSAQRRDFGPVAVRFLTSVADLLGLALENAGLYQAMRDHCRHLEIDLADWHRFLALG